MFSSAAARLRRFARCSRGNLAIIFGASLLPIAATMGAAVDFASAQGARVRLQAAADAAALAATRNYGKSWQVRQQIATDTFNANLIGVGGAEDVQFKIIDKGQSHKVDASATVDTAFTELMGVDSIDINVDAEAISPRASLEVVLVLDNTASMSSSNKIGVLRQSAENFVDMDLDRLLSGSARGTGIISGNHRRRSGTLTAEQTFGTKNERDHARNDQSTHQHNKTDKNRQGHQPDGQRCEYR